MKGTPIPSPPMKKGRSRAQLVRHTRLPKSYSNPRAGRSEQTHVMHHGRLVPSNLEVVATKGCWGEGSGGLCCWVFSVSVNLSLAAAIAA